MYVTTCLYLYRCRSLNATDLLTNSRIPESCDVFDNFIGNSEFGYYDEGTLPGIQQVLDDVLMALHSNISGNLSQCAQLIGDYLCLYYYPRCNKNNNEIIPVCSRTCNLLFNYEQCSNLLQTAVSLIVEQNITLIPNNDSCIVTYRSYVEPDQPGVSETCIPIEG